MGMIRGLPKRAEKVAEIRGTINDPKSVNHGKAAHVARYVVPACYADAGTEFVTVFVRRGQEISRPDRPDLAHCYRYSGKYRPMAATVFANSSAVIVPTVES